MKLFLRLIKQTAASWSAHKAPKMGAALAYYATFSMAPLLVLITGLAGLVVEKDDARAAILSQLSMLMGHNGEELAAAILTHTAQQASGLWATIIGFVVLLVGASGVFAELQDSLNIIWDAPLRERPWLALIRVRLLSFSMVFALGFLMLVSLAFSAAIAALEGFMKGWFSGMDMIWEGANSIISFAVITLLFAAIYRILPDVRIAWRDVWTGAAMTAVLFILGKYLLGVYIGYSAFASAYGAIGSLVVLLAWIFYSAQIFFFGAEFTCIFARKHGSHGPEATVRRKR